MMTCKFLCKRFFLAMLLLCLVSSTFRSAAAQHPNYQPTAGYFDVLAAITLLEKGNPKIEESTRNKLLEEGRVLKRIEESYANGSQPAIKRYAAAEKDSEKLAIEFKRLDAQRKQLAANPKRTKLQVDTFNAWKDSYNVRSKNHNKMFGQLVVFVNAENKRLEEKFAAFSKKVKSYVNPPPSKISATAQSMVASKMYEADENGTKCNHFVADYAKKIYDFDGFEKQNPDGTTEPLPANAIIKKIQEGNDWQRLYDETKWQNGNKPFLQAAFNKAAHYAGDGDLVVVGFKTGGPDVPNAHVAIVQQGATEKGSITWSNAGIGDLEFPRIAQAGKEVFAGKKLSFGITAGDLKKYGMVIYVLKH